MSDDLSGDLIENIRKRVEQCRRLAASILDERARKILLGMAAEGEADMRRLEAERQAKLHQPKPPAGL